MLREEILREINDVPESSLSLLLQFVRFLRECPTSQEVQTKPKGRPADMMGIFKGKAWISDDFNDKLEYVSKDELRMLEEMRAKKKAELQEAIA